MKSKDIKVSIVTVNYNGEDYLEQTIQSVINQDYNNVEYIIIDGGSSDRSIEVIEKYNSRIDYWLSEPDKGMYNALNKGFEKATGEIYAYLNSDDLYENKNVISNVVEQYRNSEFDLFYGNTIYIDSVGKEKFKYTLPPLSKNKIVALNRIPFAQSSAFWSSKIHLQVGGFDERYRLVADSDFFYKILLITSSSFIQSSSFISKFRLHENAFTHKESKLMAKETKDMLRFNNINKVNIVKKFGVELNIKLKNLKAVGK